MHNFILLCITVTIYKLNKPQRRVSFPLGRWAGMLNPGDGYPAETSPRTIGTAYDTVHAQPDVALDFPFTEVQGGWSNGLPIQYKQAFAVIHGLITPVIGHLRSLMADVNRHMIADALFFWIQPSGGH